MGNRDLNKDIIFIIDMLKDAECRYMWQKSEVSKKGKFDLVTDIDYSIEKFIKRMIKKHYPKDVIIGEEYTPNNHLGKISWTIDPIDGTVNYAHGVPLYGIQVALLYEREVTASVIYLPECGEIFWAIKGQGAYMSYEGVDGTILKTERNAKLEEAIVHMGDIPHDNKLRIKELETIGNLSKKVSKIRMHGAACVDFTSIVTGKSDGYVVFTKNLWDICPGLLICKEAGAIITNTKGEDYRFVDEGLVVSTSAKIHKCIIDALNV